MSKGRRMRTPEARTSCTESDEDGNDRITNDETSVSAADTEGENELLVLFMPTPLVLHITVQRAA
jgi:hypothetical protein